MYAGPPPQQGQPPPAGRGAPLAMPQQNGPTPPQQPYRGPQGPMQPGRPPMGAPNPGQPGMMPPQGRGGSSGYPPGQGMPPQGMRPPQAYSQAAPQPGMRQMMPPQGPSGAAGHPGQGLVPGARLMSPPMPGPPGPPGPRSLSPMMPPTVHGGMPPRGPLSPPTGNQVFAQPPPGQTLQRGPSPQSPQPPYQQSFAPPNYADGPVDQGYAGQQQGQQPMEAAMQNMNIGGPANEPDMGPTKTRRAARAYHHESETPQDQYGAGGAGLTDYSTHHNSQQQPHPYQNAPPASLPHSEQPNHFQPQPSQQPTLGPPSGPETSIPQPPHAAGQRLQGPRNRIDPEQIPSPVHVQEADQTVFDNEPYLTCARGQVPLSLTDFVSVDQGNCNPRYMRMTTYQLPVTDEMSNSAQLPIGIIVQPFATIKPEEGEIPIVDFGENGPPRCKRCRSYINPWVHFIEGGQKFICNLCGGTTEVITDYFCNLDMSGRRMDHNQRAELCRGSIDFIVPKDYWVQSESSDPTTIARPPAPLAYIFAIDVSWSGIKSGMVGEVIQGIKDVLFGVEEAGNDTLNGEAGSETFAGQKGLPVGAKVGIITFDRTVHFYNIKAGLDQAQMLVVPDLEDMFLPMAEGLLADPIESRSVIEGLLDSIPNMFAECQIVDAALGGPIQACLLTLKRLGGQVNVFLTSLPTIGPGTLQHREDQKLWGTDKEKTLFAPSDPWYRQTAEECALAGIGINMFLFPSQYIDVASIGVLSGLTGGETFFHPRFTPVKDGLRLRNEIETVLTRETVSSVTMRIRCSNGLRIAEHFGSFFQRNVTDVEFGNIDSDKAVAGHVRHDSKLDEKVDAHFQCALLYTSTNGERRVRCHNLAVPVTTVLGNVFRSADMDTTLAFMAKQYIAQAVQKSLREVRATLTDNCVKILVAYRKHCASSTSPGQLILPESYKLFPLYALALMKSKALKGGHVASDVRTHYMRHIKSLGVAATVLLLYPKMYAIHGLTEDVGRVGDDGRMRMPRLMRTSYQRMEPHGAYIIDNGDVALLWLGAAVSPQIIRDLYGVDTLEEIDSRMSTLPSLPTLLSRQVRECVARCRSSSGTLTTTLTSSRYQRSIVVARQHRDGSEVEFANLLVEDENNDAMSYVDYLCFVHKQIQTDLAGEKKDEVESSIWRGTW